MRANRKILIAASIIIIMSIIFFLQYNKDDNDSPNNTTISINNAIYSIKLDITNNNAIAVLLNNPSKEILDKVSNLKTFDYDKSNESVLIVPIFNNTNIKITTLEWSNNKLNEVKLVYNEEDTSDGFGLLINAYRPEGIPSLKFEVRTNDIVSEYILSYDGLNGAPDIEYITSSSESLVYIPKIELNIDKDGDGILDLDDIVEGARKDMNNRPMYKSAYYSGGYPPDDEGVCTDVIWRALLNAGYNLKDMIDKDIKENLSNYPRVDNNPDPNIDFRRVKNLIPFFKKYALSLTTGIIPYDVENLTEWQAGDIVIFGEPLEHIAIVSNVRRKDGVPLIIHNSSPYTMENDKLLTWPSPLTHHFRFPKP